MARRPLCLIVNPSAGGGRAARLLPRVEEALRARGMRFRVERTHSLAHARELARAALAAGEVAAAMGGDGLIGAVAGELRGTDGVLGVLPGGRGNDFARKLGIGPDPERACDVLAGGRERRDRRRRGRRAHLPRDRLGGLRLRRAGHRQRDAAPARRARLRLRDAARAARLAAGALAGRRRRRARTRSTATPSRSPTPASSAAACTSCRTRRSTTACSTSCSPRAAPKRRYLLDLPKVFRGTHVDEPGPDVPARARDRVPRRPAVRRLRRRRPDRRPARHHQGRAARAEGARPVTLLGPKVAAAQARSARSSAPRAAAAARRCPARCSRALEPHAIGLLGGAAARTAAR